MPALVAGIHVFRCRGYKKTWMLDVLRHARACRGHPRLPVQRLQKDVDGRNKSGHDEKTMTRSRDGGLRLRLTHPTSYYDLRPFLLQPLKDLVVHGGVVLRRPQDL